MKIKQENTPTGTKRNVKINGYSSAGLWAKRKRKREQAEERQEKFDKLGTKEKLRRAKTINPNSKETKKLEARLETEKTLAAAHNSTVVTPNPIGKVKVKNK